MEFADWMAILTLLGGSGIIATGITLLYNWKQSKLEREIQDRRDATANKIQDRREATARDFEARRDAKRYYMRLYARIGILDEMTKSYKRSLQEKGNAEVFSYEECKLVVHTSEAISEDFKKAYAEFLSFYLKKACLGYEIFVSKKLRELLIEFWKRAKGFNDDVTKMKDEKAVTEFNTIAEKQQTIWRSCLA